MVAILMCQQGIPFRVSPARTQMIEELEKRGIEVILFFPGNVHDAEIKKKARAVVNTSRMKDAAVRKRIREIDPDIIICFTQEDTQICFPLPYEMRRTDFYYYNLEIYVYRTPPKGVGIYRRFAGGAEFIQKKIKEMLYVKGCRSLVIQDKLREKVLKKYGISHARTWLIPNSYYINDGQYDVPRKTGLIYSGSVDPGIFGTFMERAEDLKDVEITISGWRHAGIRAKDHPNIKVIRQELSQEEYTAFISAYDIALLWYSDKGDDNVYYIGLASGKYFKHLSLGQPVILNRVPGLAKEVERYQVGVVIDDIKELGAAAKTIRADYDTYVRNIRRIYRKRYDYAKASGRFFDEVVSNAEKRS